MGRIFFLLDALISLIDHFLCTGPGENAQLLFRSTGLNRESLVKKRMFTKAGILKKVQGYLNFIIIIIFIRFDKALLRQISSLLFCSMKKDPN